MKQRERQRQLCNLTCLNTKNFECSGASRLAQPQQWNSDRLVPGKSGPKAPNAFPEWKMKGRSKQTLLKRPAETVNSNWVDGWKNTNESRNRSGRQVFWWHRRRRRRRLLKGSKSFVLPQCANKRRRSIHLHCTSFPKMKTQFRLTWSPQIKKTLLSKVSAFYAPSANAATNVRRYRATTVSDECSLGVWLHFVCRKKLEHCSAYCRVYFADFTAKLQGQLTLLMHTKKTASVLIIFQRKVFRK